MDVGKARKPDPAVIREAKARGVDAVRRIPRHARRLALRCQPFCIWEDGSPSMGARGVGKAKGCPNGVEDAPAIHVLNSAASTDVSGQLRYHLVYKEPPGLKIGDVLSFRGVICTVVFVEVGKGLSDDTDPTHNVAMCRVVGGA